MRLWILTRGDLVQVYRGSSRVEFERNKDHTMHNHHWISICGLTDFVICLSVSTKNAALLMHYKRDLIWNGWKVYGIKEFKEMNSRWAFQYSQCISITLCRSSLSAEHILFMAKS